MDYAFAPGTDVYSMRAKLLLSRNVNITLKSQPKFTVLKDFVDFLGQQPSGSVGNIYLVSHASKQGTFNMPLVRQAKQTTVNPPPPTTYEDLQDTIDTPAHSIMIPSAVLNGPSNAVYILGCNIGQATQLLEKLKEALGGQLAVTAPRHYHVLADAVPYVPKPPPNSPNPPAPPASPTGSSNLKTIVEYLNYGFRVSNPTPYTTRSQLVAAFQAASAQGKFSTLGNVLVPNTAWDTGKLIPTEINGKGNGTPQVDVQLKSPIGPYTTQPLFSSFTSWSESKVAWNILYQPGAIIPTSLADRLQALTKQLNQDARFQPGRLFPIPVRYGFTDIDSYVAGYTWTFTPISPAPPTLAKLVCTGTRQIYEVQFPITEAPPAGGLYGKLLMNTYPDPSVLSVVPVRDLKTSDPTLFTTV